MPPRARPLPKLRRRAPIRARTAGYVPEDPLKLLTLEELERLFRAPGETPAARRVWLIRKLKEWGIWNDGEHNPRFLRSTVEAAVKKHLGKK